MVVHLLACSTERLGRQLTEPRSVFSGKATEMSDTPFISDISNLLVGRCRLELGTNAFEPHHAEHRHGSCSAEASKAVVQSSRADAGGNRQVTNCNRVLWMSADQFFSANHMAWGCGLGSARKRQSVIAGLRSKKAAHQSLFNTGDAKGAAQQRIVPIQLIYDEFDKPAKTGPEPELDLQLRFKLDRAGRGFTQKVRQVPFKRRAINLQHEMAAFGIPPHTHRKCWRSHRPRDGRADELVAANLDLTAAPRNEVDKKER